VDEPKGRPTRKRKPSLRAVLIAAKKAGAAVRTAVVDADGNVTLEFGEPTANTNENEWDRALHRGKH
jgi:hypothetical protein